jgi:hypothetical protein
METKYIIVPDHITQYTFPYFEESKACWREESESIESQPLQYHTIQYSPGHQGFPLITVGIDNIPIQVIRESDYRKLHEPTPSPLD